MSNELAWATIVLMNVSIYLYGFSFGAKEARFYYYGIVFLLLGWIPESISLFDPAVRTELTSASAGSWGYGAIRAVGFATMAFLSGYLSGRWYRRWKTKKELGAKTADSEE